MHATSLASDCGTGYVSHGVYPPDEAETKMLENWDRIEVRLERAMALMGRF